MYHLLALRGTKALRSISSLSDKDSVVTAEASVLFHNMIDTYRKKQPECGGTRHIGQPELEREGGARRTVG